MQNSTEFHWPCLFPPNQWVEHNSTNSSRIYHTVVSQFDRNSQGSVISDPVTMWSHMGGCTSVCKPLKTGWSGWCRARTSTCIASTFCRHCHCTGMSEVAVVILWENVKDQVKTWYAQLQRQRVVGWCENRGVSRKCELDWDRLQNIESTLVGCSEVQERCTCGRQY